MQLHFQLKTIALFLCKTTLRRRVFINLRVCVTIERVILALMESSIGKFWAGAGVY